MPLAYLAAPALIDANVQLHPNTVVKLVDPTTGEAPNIYATAVSTVPLAANQITSDANGNFRSSAGRYWTDSTATTFLTTVDNGPGIVDIDVFQINISEAQATAIIAASSSVVKTVLLQHPDSTGDVSFNVNDIGGASQASLNALSDSVSSLGVANMRAQIAALQQSVLALQGGGGGTYTGYVGATWYPADATPAELAARTEIDNSYPAWFTGDPGLSPVDKVYFGSTHDPAYDGASLSQLTTQFGQPVGGTYYSNLDTVTDLNTAFNGSGGIVSDETNGAFMRYERDTSKRAENWGEPANLNGATWWRWIANGGMDDDKTVTVTKNGVTTTGNLFGLRTEARMVMKGKARLMSREHEWDITSEAGGYTWPIGSSTIVSCGSGADFQAMWWHVWQIYRQEWIADPTLNWPIWFCNMSYSPLGGTFGKTSNKVFASSSITDVGSDGYFPGWGAVDCWGTDPYDNSGAVVNGSAVTGSTSWSALTADMVTCYNQFCNVLGGRTNATSPAGILPNKPIWYGERGVIDKLPNVTYTNTKSTSDVWMAAMAANDTTNAAKTAGATWFSKNYAANGSVNTAGLNTAPRFAFSTDSDQSQKWAGLKACGALYVYETAKGWQAAPVNPVTPPPVVTNQLTANLSVSVTGLTITASAALSTAGNVYALQDYTITWPDGTSTAALTSFTTAQTKVMATSGSGIVKLVVRDTSLNTDEDDQNVSYNIPALFNAPMDGPDSATVVSGDVGIGGATGSTTTNPVHYGIAAQGIDGLGSGVICGNATGAGQVIETYAGGSQTNVYIRGYYNFQAVQAGTGASTFAWQEKSGSTVIAQAMIDHNTGLVSIRKPDGTLATGTKPTSVNNIDLGGYIRWEWTRKGTVVQLALFITNPDGTTYDDLIDGNMTAGTGTAFAMGVPAASATTRISVSQVAGSSAVMPLPVSGSAAPVKPNAPTLGVPSPGPGTLSVPFTFGAANGSAVSKVTLTLSGPTPKTQDFTSSPAVFTGLTTGSYSVSGTDTNAIGASIATALTSPVTVTGTASTQVLSATFVAPTGATDGQAVVNGDGGLGGMTIGSSPVPPSYSLQFNSVNIRPGSTGYPLLQGTYSSGLTNAIFAEWGYKVTGYPVSTYDNIAQLKNSSTVVLHVRQNSNGTLGVSSADGTVVANSTTVLTLGSKYSLCLITSGTNGTTVKLKIYIAGGALLETVTMTANSSTSHNNFQIGATGSDTGYNAYLYSPTCDTAVEPPIEPADNSSVATPPGVPTGVTATAVADTASQKIAWFAPVTTGTYPLTGFQVFIDGVLTVTVSTPTTLNATVSGQSAGAHVATVKAIATPLVGSASSSAGFSIAGGLVTPGPPVPIATDAYANLVESTTPLFNGTFWTFPGVSTAPIHPNSDAIVAELHYDVISVYGDTPTSGVAAANIHQFNTSVIIAPVGTPYVRVYFYDQQGKGSEPATFTSAMMSVPVPDNAVPSTGSDGMLGIVDASNGDLWECWQMMFNRPAGTKDQHGNVLPGFPDEWSACWGGKTNIYTGTGWFLNGTGASSTGCVVAAGVAGIREMQYALAHGNAPLGHTLNMATNTVAPAQSYQWPAQRGDGGSSSVSLIAEGQWFRLDPTINVDTIAGLSNIGKVIAKTAQVHGIINTDQSGAVSLIFESPNQLKAAGQVDPWLAMEKTNGGTAIPDWTLLTNFPWDKMQALIPNWGSPTGYLTYKVPSGANTTVNQNSVLFLTCPSNAMAVSLASWLNYTVTPPHAPYTTDPSASHNLIDSQGTLIGTAAYVVGAQQAAILLNGAAT